MLSQYSFLRITSNLPVVSSAPGSWSFCHRQCHGTRCFSVSLRSLYYCKALALDRGACHPHTVIIPELTSPLSIELLRRWRGHRIPCSERQRCSRPSGLGLQRRKKKSKMDAAALKQTILLSPCCLCHLRSYKSGSNCVKETHSKNEVISHTFWITTCLIEAKENK